MKHFSGDVKVLFKFSQGLANQTRSSVAQALDLQFTHVHHPYSFHQKVTAGDMLMSIMTYKSAHLDQTELMSTNSSATSHAFFTPNLPHNFCNNWSIQRCLNNEWYLSIISCLLLTSESASRGVAGTWEQQGGKCSFPRPMPYHAIIWFSIGGDSVMWIC